MGKDIGLIGLGNMGLPMTRDLTEVCYKVKTFDTAGWAIEACLDTRTG